MCRNIIEVLTHKRDVFKARRKAIQWHMHDMKGTFTHVRYLLKENVVWNSLRKV